MNQSARMGIGLIGDLPAGAVMAQALAGAGHALIGRSAPPEDRADHVEALLPGVPVVDAVDIVQRSEMVILATDGDALEHLIARLRDQAVVQPGHIITHISAQGSIEQLAPLMGQGAIALRLIPLIPLTGHSLDIRRLRGGWCAVVANGPVSPIGQALALEMGMDSLVVDPGQEAALENAIQVATSGASSFVHDAIDGLLDQGVEQAAPAMAALLHAHIDQAVRDNHTGAAEDLSLTGDDLEDLLGPEPFGDGTFGDDPGKHDG